jgi:hypothetical protein
MLPGGCLKELLLYGKNWFMTSLDSNGLLVAQWRKQDFGSFAITKSYHFLGLWADYSARYFKIIFKH